MRRALSIAAAIGIAGVPAAHASEPPMVLPGDARAAAVHADGETWIVGARPGAVTAGLARRFGARRVGSAGAHVLSRARARAFARALRRRGALVFAEPNVISRLDQTRAATR